LEDILLRDGELLFGEIVDEKGL